MADRGFLFDGQDPEVTQERSETRDTEDRNKGDG